MTAFCKTFEGNFIYFMVFSFLQKKCHPPTSRIKKSFGQSYYNVIFLFEKDRTQILKKGMPTFTTY